MYEIRKITSNEVEEAFALAWEVFMQFEAPDYKLEGAETFKRDIIENESFIAKCKRGECPIYAAFDGTRIVSIMGMRSGKTHINLVFTKKEYHRRGIATAVFNYLLADIKRENPAVEEITLNSSPYGKPFYLHLGFVPVSEEQEIDGIRFTPMKYIVRKIIREINRDDIPECAGVIREAFMTVANEFGFTKQNAPGFTAFSMCTEKLFRQYEKEHRPMYAYFNAGKIVGYYSLELLENQECELNNLAVLPSYRHQGIGEKLLSHSFEEARKMNCKIMKIGIVEENKILRKWYEAHGFVHTGTEKFDFFPFTCGYMKRAVVTPNEH